MAFAAVGRIPIGHLVRGVGEIAVDATKRRLAAARPRLRRSGVDNVECRYITGKGE